MSKKRIEWIDVAKGIGTLLVILSHLTQNDQFLRTIIFSFHMPLFFFLSGMVFSNKKPFKQFLFRKIRTLYIPYVIFLILDYFISFILSCIQNGFSINMVKDISFLFFKSLIGWNFMQNIYSNNPPIWFLCALFFASIVLYFVLKLNKALVILAIPLCILLTYFISVPLPFGISHIIAALPFMIIGYFSKALFNKFNNLCISKIKIKKYSFICLIILTMAFIFVISIVISKYNGFVSMQSLEYGNTLLFYINAIIGIIVVCGVSIILPKLRIIKYYGENSIIILCVHFYLCRKLIPYLFNCFGIESLLYNFGIELLLTVFVALLMIPVIFIANKYLSVFFGKNKLT